jgi:CRISPR system Cascade subunit CasA
VLNLVDDPWLPAQYADGRVERVSLRTVLLEADQVRALPVESPTLLPAVLRQALLPLLWGAVGVPASMGEWARRREAGRLSPAEREQVEASLVEQRDRFFLFDEKRPFAQVGGLEASSGETKPVSLLIPSVATGNNVPMFTAFPEDYPFSLSAEDAALWLLHAHCWDTAAIKTGAKGDGQAKQGKTTGNPTGPLGQYGVVVPEGSSLYETLLLNTPVIPDGLPARDRPQWAGEGPAGPGWESRPARGLLDALTWQSRRIRLFPEETDAGVRVSRVLVCAGDRLSGVRPESEWHTAWTYTAKPKKGQAPLRPRRHRADEHAWQGMAALLELGREGDEGPRTSGLLDQLSRLEVAGHLPEDFPLQVRTCGVVYGNQSAVVEDMLADALPLPVAALAADSRTRGAVLEAVDQAWRLSAALNGLSADLRRAEGAEPLPWDKGQRPSAEFLQSVDLPMRRLLRGLQAEAADDDRIEQGMTAWEQVLQELAWKVAVDLLAAASPSTFLGRKEKEGGRVWRAAFAERAFRRTAHQVLYRAAEARQAEETETAEDDA